MKRFNPLSCPPASVPDATPSDSPPSPPLERGRVVHCAAAGEDAVVLKFTPGAAPVQHLSGGAVSLGGGDVEVAFTDHVQTVPECIVRGLGWTITDDILPEAAVATREQTARAAFERNKLEQAERERRRPILFAKHYGQPDAPHVIVEPGMMAVTLCLCHDNSDSMTDYFDRHASLAPDFALLLVKKQNQTERLARRALALCPELAGLEWEWHTEKYSLGHGNYLESSGFELPGELQNLQTRYRGGGVTHAHWEIQFAAPYRGGGPGRILPHKNYGRLPTPPPPVGKARVEGEVRVIESVHTRHGHKIFVVQLGTRVERPLYEQMLAVAKSLGGYYSSYRGHGALPGFIFKTGEPAARFVEAARAALGKPERIPVQPETPPTPEPIPAPVENIVPVKFSAVPLWKQRFGRV